MLHDGRHTVKEHGYMLLLRGRHKRLYYGKRLRYIRRKRLRYKRLRYKRLFKYSYFYFFNYLNVYISLFIVPCSKHI